MPHFWCLLYTYVAIQGAVAGPGPSAAPPAGVAETRSEPSAESVDYTRDILPLFQDRCLDCHGPDEQESGLRLDSRASLLRGGDSGEPAVIPGKPADSFLIQVVSGLDEDIVMPPEGEKLSPMQLELLRTWIADGAKMPADSQGATLSTDHWSFQPVANVQPPSIAGMSRLNPVDAFVRQRLADRGIKPSRRADRRTLIRRLYLVMHGLPPTVEQVDRFVDDESPTAWRELVDEVLGSPRYGERWARHWLDLIRFGETHGFETNRERPNAWHFRDWVIHSLNHDKPYDQFVREQIAGDALGEPIATGFLVAGPHDLVKSPDINLTLTQRQDELSDLINTTGTAFLGLTLGCARCHNHKFDPVTQRDFYAVQAVFAGVQHGDRPLPIPAGRQQELVAIRRSVAELRERLEPFIPKAGDGALRPDDATAGGPTLRPPVNARHNVEHFQPAAARFVRFTILATNSSQPCLDELEIFSKNENVALAERGAVATCSSSLPGYEIHKLAHINDGKYGNSRSWISNESGKGWVQIQLPTRVEIDRIEWGRDRERKYRDRVATQYRIESSVDGQAWQVVASSEGRLPFKTEASAAPTYQFDRVGSEQAEQGRRWLAELEGFLAAQQRLETVPSVYAGTFTEPPPTHRLYRGDPLAKREEVLPDTLEVVGSLGLAADTAEQQRRLRFAEWVASPDNPLTARVMMNRVWQFHFGTGIVGTPSDFGANGIPPSHPELLDWLAAEFVRQGWSLKQMHRLILLSATWRQDSRPVAASLERDASSRELWRFPPRRLEAEAIRDSMLAASGVLDLTMGGPGFSGFEVELENVRHFFPKKRYGPEDYRRMIYMTVVRQERESVFGVFDCPDASQVVPRRGRSTTPLQALNLLNSRFTNQQAELLSERLAREAGPAAAAQVRLAFALCYGRKPDDEELAMAVPFVRSEGLPQFCRALLNSNEFLFIP